MKSGFLKRLALSNRRDKYSDGGQNSLIFGKNGGDVIKGNNGNDDIRGQGGNDKLFGGRGRDILRGGKGRNKLSGGRGKDSFAISDGFSTILDYQLGVDKLLIDFEKYSDFAVSARGSSSSLQYNDTTGKQWSFIFKNISSEDLSEDVKRFGIEIQPPPLIELSAFDSSKTIHEYWDSSYTLPSTDKFMSSLDPKGMEALPSEFTLDSVRDSYELFSSTFLLMFNRQDSVKDPGHPPYLEIHPFLKNLGVIDTLSDETTITIDINKQLDPIVGSPLDDLLIANGDHVDFTSSNAVIFNPQRTDLDPLDSYEDPILGSDLLVLNTNTANVDLSKSNNAMVLLTGGGKYVIDAPDKQTRSFGSGKTQSNTPTMAIMGHANDRALIDIDVAEGDAFTLTASLDGLNISFRLGEEVIFLFGPHPNNINWV